jgi:hypothetical protein
MAAFKWKHCNSRELESDLRVAVLAIQPRMSHVFSNQQAHLSRWVSTISHFYTLSSSIVSIGKDSLISLRGHGKLEDQINGK